MERKPAEREMGTVETGNRRPAMTKHFDMGFFANAILGAEESDSPIAVWTLDELEQLADLDSVRAARSHTDGLERLHA